MRFQVEDRRLGFLLGEIPVGSAGLRLRVCQTNFTELTPESAPTAEDVAALPKGVSGILMESLPVAEDLKRISFTPKGCLRYARSHFRRFYTDLTGTFEGYLANFSGKSRSTWRRKVRKFAKLSGGEIDWREYRTPDEVEEFYGLARAVSERTYQERLLDAGLPETEEFRAEMRERAASDRVRAYLLFHEGQAVAYLYSPLDEGVLIYQYLGYEPDLSKLSPGTVLQYLVFERLFAEGGYRIFDFTQGEGAHKEFFATDNVPCAVVYYLRRTFWNVLLVYLHAGLDSFSSAVAFVLDKLGLKKRIKRFIRAIWKRKDEAAPAAEETKAAGTATAAH